MQLKNFPILLRVISKKRFSRRCRCLLLHGKSCDRRKFSEEILWLLLTRSSLEPQLWSQPHFSFGHFLISSWLKVKNPFSKFGLYHLMKRFVLRQLLP